MAPATPAAESAPEGPAPRRRPRVLATRGLVASAAVLALAVQAEQADPTGWGDGVPTGDPAGDQTASAPVDPGPVDDA